MAVRNDPYRCRHCALPRRKPQRRRSGERGFTLLELLVALTLLGLVLAAIFGELRFTTRAWDATDAKIDRNGELLSVHSFLRTRLQQIQQPAATAEQRDAATDDIFTGNSRAMTFVATMPANVSEGGFYDISLSQENDADGDTLFISWRPFDAEGAAPANSAENSRVLLRGVRDVRFSYFGQTNDSVAAQWWDNWPVRDRTPSVVRVEVNFQADDPRVWPELVVSPAIANPVSVRP